MIPPPTQPPPDARDDFQHDKDRILYSQAFRRLAGITQVIPVSEGVTYHNRLTHSLKVAQLGRSITQLLHAKEAVSTKETVGGIDSNVVEAACLAHDLGHPPFGHIAEVELLKFAQGKGFLDAFEGNAQSFRIVTRLAQAYSICDGLNLTGATLNAILKYPWLRQTDGTQREKKYGAYTLDGDYFQWARECYDRRDNYPTAEAEIMNWADDIAYSCHDMEDFYRAGIIKLDRLLTVPAEVDKFIAEVFDSGRLKKEFEKTQQSQTDFKEAFCTMIQGWPSSFQALRDPFSGTDAQRKQLKGLNSNLVGRFVDAIRLNPNADVDSSKVQIDVTAYMEVTMLKELTWHYVITSPALAAMQLGQRKIIRYVLHELWSVLESDNWSIFPIRYRKQLEGQARDKALIGRTVFDMVAGMTEQEVIEIYKRFKGLSTDSVLREAF